MKTRFAFGKHGIEVAVPQGFDCQVVRSRDANAVRDVAGALDAAPEAIAGALARAAIDQTARPATLSIADFVRLADALKRAGAIASAPAAAAESRDA